MEIILIIIGSIILLVNFFDFFHTTLSGNGFWIISNKVNIALSTIILKNKSKSIFDYSGLIHLLATTFIWLFFLILGTFIIFMGGEEMVVNATSKVPATIIERFYYTCYLLSTLGIGDFVPGNNASRLISSILSFSGFIFLTIAMTYLISVVNAVLSKRKLALYIATLGDDIEDLYKFFIVDESLSTLTQKSSDLRQLIITNSSNYLAFPIVHHFLTTKKSHSLVVQLASLYEVLTILRRDFDEESIQYVKIDSILKSVEYYLSQGLNIKNKLTHDPEKLAALRQFWGKHDKVYEDELQNSEKIGATIEGAGWAWEDVYRLKE